MAHTKQKDTDFHIEPLNGSAQCITNPINIPTTLDGIDYQHRVVADGICGNIHVTRSCTMGEMKYPATPFRKYLNQDKVYVLPTVLGLVNTRIISVILQTDPQLTFRDIKASIMDIMCDKTSLSVFAKGVR
jgi:hypothetical protein